MKNIDKTVLKETLYIALFVIIFSVLTQAVFLIIQKWDYTVLLGNLLGGIVAVGNFFLMGLTVQSAINKEEKHAKNIIKISQSLRMIMIFVMVAIGVSFSCFNTVTTLVPLFFPRIAIAFRPLFLKEKNVIKS